MVIVNFEEPKEEDERNKLHTRPDSLCLHAGRERSMEDDDAMTPTETARTGGTLGTVGSVGTAGTVDTRLLVTADTHSLMQAVRKRSRGMPRCISLNLHITPFETFFFKLKTRS